MRWASATNLSNDGSDVSESNTSVALRVKIRKASLTGMGTLESDSLFKSSLLRQHLLLPLGHVDCSILGLQGVMIKASYCYEGFNVVCPCNVVDDVGILVNAVIVHCGDLSPP
jgi:hypothetical protein